MTGGHQPTTVQKFTPFSLSLSHLPPSFSLVFPRSFSPCWQPGIMTPAGFGRSQCMTSRNWHHRSFKLQLSVTHCNCPNNCRNLVGGRGQHQRCNFSLAFSIMNARTYVLAFILSPCSLGPASCLLARCCSFVYFPVSCSFSLLHGWCAIDRNKHTLLHLALHDGWSQLPRVAGALVVSK